MADPSITDVTMGDAAPADQAHHPSAALICSWLTSACQLDQLLQPDEQGYTALDKTESLLLQVSAFDALNLDRELGCCLMGNAEGVRRQLLEALHAEQLTPCKYPRIWLRMNQVPLPCTTPAEMTSSIVHRGPQLVSFHGLVTCVRSLSQKVYSRTVRCPHCCVVREVLESAGAATAVPCCEMQCIYRDLEEDLACRVLVPCQTLLVSDLSSALGAREYHAAEEAVTVHLLDDLAGTAKIGDIVQVIGYARTTSKSSSRLIPSAAATASVEVDANNIISITPHEAWRSAKEGAGMMQGPHRPSSSVLSDCSPIQVLCNLLMAQLDTYMEPPLCLALLLSAASVGVRADGDGRQSEAPVLANMAGAFPALQKPQISLLLGHEAFDPTPLRILRAAAALLSPHSLLLSPQLEDLLSPRLVQYRDVDCEAQDQLAVHASVLSSANHGVLVVDSTTLAAKAKAQLGEVMGRQQLVMHASKSELTVPVTPTVWAAANQGVGAEGKNSKGAARKLMAAGGAEVPAAGRAWGGLEEGVFDLILRYRPDDDLVMAQIFDAQPVDDVDQGVGAAGIEQQDMQRVLHHHLALAVCGPNPRLTERSAELLMRYLVAVRQSGVQVPHGDLLASLIKISTACARLMHREQVEECPDCVVAVLLLEDTLVQRFGEGYQALGLPQLDGLQGDAESDGSIDRQLEAVYPVVQSVLKGFAPVNWVEE